jgi:multiple sugar transport system permease protein
MIPEQAVFIPLHTMFSAWGQDGFVGHNTHFALVTPRVAVPIGVFLMMQFFRAVPRELEEAAELDHASRFTIFWKIMLPLSVPALTTLGPLHLHPRLERLPVAARLGHPGGHVHGHGGPRLHPGQLRLLGGLGSVMASAVFASLPIVILFLIFQRYIVAGVAMSAGK